MLHPLRPVAKFCEWAWSPMPFSVKQSKHRSATNFFRSISQLSGRVLELAIIVNYLALVVKCVPVPSPYYEIASLVLKHTITIALCAALILIVARLAVSAFEHFKKTPPPADEVDGPEVTSSESPKSEGALSPRVSIPNVNNTPQMSPSSSLSSEVRAEGQKDGKNER